MDDGSPTQSNEEPDATPQKAGSEFPGIGVPDQHGDPAVAPSRPVDQAPADATMGQQDPPIFATAVAQPKADPWRATDLLLFVGFSVIWAFLSGVLLLAGYAILRPIVGWHTPPAALLENTLFGLLVQIVLYVPVLIYMILLVTVHYRLPFWEGIRWRWPGGSRAARLLLGGVVLALAVALGAAVLPDRTDFPLEKMFSSPAAAYGLAAFAVLIAPFMEELIFRGVLFAFFEQLGGVRWAVGGTAALFAALHYPEYQGAWTHLGMILVVGVVFSLARAITRSVVPSFLLHTGYNATFILALFVATHHFRNLPSLLVTP